MNANRAAVMQSAGEAFFLGVQQPLRKLWRAMRSDRLARLPSLREAQGTTQSRTGDAGWIASRRSHDAFITPT